MNQDINLEVRLLGLEKIVGDLIKKDAEIEELVLGFHNQISKMMPLLKVIAEADEKKVD